MKKHGIYYDSRIKLLLILLTSALAFALGGGLTGLLLFGVVSLFALLSGLWKTSIKFAIVYIVLLMLAQVLPIHLSSVITFFLLRILTIALALEYSVSDYGNIGIDSSASGKSYPPSNRDTSGYHIKVSTILETRCSLYKTGNENEGRRIVLLEDNKSSSTDIRRLFNPHTYAPSDDSDRIIRISRNARHQLSL